MSKFKVGDKIVKVAGGPSGQVCMGSTATVKRVGSCLCVDVHNGPNGWLADPDLWELAKDAKPTSSSGERDPTGKSLNEPGAKADAGKLRPSLVFRDMAHALAAVSKIATDGAAKYSDGGWLEVPNGPDRYEDADLRHMLKRFTGQQVDSDSQALHLAHEAWNALAKLELYLQAHPQYRVL